MAKATEPFSGRARTGSQGCGLRVVSQGVSPRGGGGAYKDLTHMVSFSGLRAGGAGLWHLKIHHKQGISGISQCLLLPVGVPCELACTLWGYI